MSTSAPLCSYCTTCPTTMSPTCTSQRHARINTTLRKPPLPPGCKTADVPLPLAFLGPRLQHRQGPLAPCSTNPATQGARAKVVSCGNIHPANRCPRGPLLERCHMRSLQLHTVSYATATQRPLGPRRARGCWARGRPGTTSRTWQSTPQSQRTQSPPLSGCSSWSRSRPQRHPPWACHRRRCNINLNPPTAATPHAAAVSPCLCQHMDSFYDPANAYLPALNRMASNLDSFLPPTVSTLARNPVTPVRSPVRPLPRANGACPET